MAYREKVFNANVLTDLLSTYLTHKAQEREKYYDAEVKASQPIYRTVNKDLYRINPRTGESSLLIKGERTEKEPDFEDFPQVDKDGNPTGMSIKGMFTGTDKPFTGVPLGYEPVGKKPQFKPEDPEAEEKKIESKNISAMVNEATRLRRLKDKDYDAVDQMLIQKGFAPPAFTSENQNQLNYYESELRRRGFNIYGEQINNNNSSELLQNLKNEFPAVGEGSNPLTEKDAEYYYSDKGRSDFQKMIKEFEQKYPPGTYEPLKIDMKKERLWHDLTNKYLPKESKSLANKYFLQYKFNVQEKFGKKGSFWK